MPVINTKRLMILGYGTIILLMALVIIISLDQMNLSFLRIQQVVNTNNYKTSLVSRMLISARERTMSIQKIASLDDPFKRDDEFMTFNRYGAKFIESREELKRLELSDVELELLEAQGKITQEVVVPLQRQIADLALTDRVEEARALLQTEAITSQNKVFDKLYLLLNHVEKSSAQAVQDVSDNQQKSKTKLILILFVIIICSIIVSWYVIRRSGITEKQLYREKERAQVTLQSIGDGVIRTDAQGKIEYMNTVAEGLTGYSCEEVRGQIIENIFPISSDLQDIKFFNPVHDVINKKVTQISDGHAILTNAHKREFAIEYIASPINDSSKEVIGIVLVFRDVTSMRAMANQLGYQATHDGLTGLINRNEFENRIELALQSARIDDVEHSMCYLDLDQFKIVNDTCGHVAGDELLRQLSKLLKQEIREGDTLARLGGDEFGVLYLNCMMQKAQSLAENLQRTINDFKFNWNNKSFTVGVSAGIVQINKHGNLNSLLSAADSACYIAKDKGRNRIHCYHENDNELIEREGQMQWVHRISKALEENRFVLYCQPICNIALSNCNHYEILVRLIDEEEKINPPMAFIPAAERYNMMSLIDSWIFKKSLKIISNLLCTTDIGTKPVFAINLSAQSLCDDEFLSLVQLQFTEHNIDPSYICFEITETSAIVNLTRAQHFINTLKKIGVRFSLDDFGSGLSSFAYLKNLPVDYLKIDGAFVRDIIKDPIDLALVESINQVGHIMGIKTIAEYVEDYDIYEKLKGIGVDYAQGYYVSQPVLLKGINLNESDYLRDKKACTE